MTIKIDYIAGNCPVQAEGMIDGVPFYFRARFEHWSLSIGGEPVGAPDWHMEESFGEGEDYAAGWMSEDEARGFIAKAADIWRAERAEGLE